MDHARVALDGRVGYGRWGTPNGFPVLYLGRPIESVVVEAYRHLIDPIQDAAAAAQLAQNLAPRALITCTVSVSEVLDLRHAGTRGQLSLTTTELRSDTSDRDAYARCQQVAQVAHQLGLHGVLAPAATGMGDTLALFTDLLPDAERPVRVGEDQLWQGLPPDPRAEPGRRLSIVQT
jgi:RES domain-containing protein